MHDVYLLPAVSPAGVGARVGAGVVVGAACVVRQYSIRHHIVNRQSTIRRLDKVAKCTVKKTCVSHTFYVIPRHTSIQG